MLAWVRVVLEQSPLLAPFAAIGLGYGLLSAMATAMRFGRVTPDESRFR